jgi:hypothetical protein
MSLFNAALEGDLDKVNKFIAEGYDVNHVRKKDGVTPLHIAAQNGHDSVVSRLIAAGANVNQASTGEATPLYIAAYQGHDNVVKELISGDANVNQANKNGVTPLYIAAQNGHDSVVKQLISADTNVNQARTDGATPLYIAAQKGHDNVVSALIRAGASIGNSNLFCPVDFPKCNPLNKSCYKVNYPDTDPIYKNKVFKDGCKYDYKSAKSTHPPDDPLSEPLLTHSQGGGSLKSKRRKTKRRNTKRRNTKRRKTKNKKTKRRKTKNRYTKKKIMGKVNNKSDINKFIRGNLPGYKLIKILNSKQTGGGLYDDYNRISSGDLGVGSFGNVFLVKSTRNPDQVAVVKEFSDAPPGTPRARNQEARLRAKKEALDNATREFFFGQIVKALTVDNDDLKRKLDSNKELNMNMVVLFRIDEDCDNYLALYNGYNRNLFSSTHKLLLFNVNTNSSKGCSGGHRGHPVFTQENLTNGGYKLFHGVLPTVPKDAIRLPPRVEGKDYSSVKVAKYIKQYSNNIVMEPVDGKPLHEYFGDRVLRGHIIDEYKLRPIIIQVLNFISMINNSYLSHNDFNFGNIMVDDRNPNVSVTVIDYGLMTVTGYYYFLEFDKGIYWRPKNYIYNGPAGPDEREHNPLFIYNNTDTYNFFLNLVIILNHFIKYEFDDNTIIDDILNDYKDPYLAPYFQYWSDEFKNFMKLALTYDNKVKAAPYGSTPADSLLEEPWISKDIDKDEADEKWEKYKVEREKKKAAKAASGAAAKAATEAAAKAASGAAAEATAKAASGTAAKAATEAAAKAADEAAQLRMVQAEIAAFQDELGMARARPQVAAKAATEAVDRQKAEEKSKTQGVSMLTDPGDEAIIKLISPTRDLITTVDADGNVKPEYSKYYDKAREQAINQEWKSKLGNPIYVKVVGEVYGISTGDYGYVSGIDGDGKYKIIFNTEEKNEELQFLQNRNIYKVIPKEYIEHRHMKLIEPLITPEEIKQASEQAKKLNWISTQEHPIYVYFPLKSGKYIGYVVGIDDTGKYKIISNNGVIKASTWAFERWFRVIPNENVDIVSGIEEVYLSIPKPK